jgi:hypothetical protein
VNTGEKREAILVPPKEKVRGIVGIVLVGLSVAFFGVGITGYLNPSLGLWLVFFAVVYWLWEILTSPRAVRTISSWKTRTTIGTVMAIIIVSIPWPHPALAKHSAIEIYEPQILPVEPFVPFHEGEIVKLDLRYHMVGKYPVRNDAPNARIYIRHLESMTEGQMFSDFQKSADFEPAERMLLSPDAYRYGTYYSQKLTQDDVAGVNSIEGKVLLCMVGAVRWEDETGAYRTDMCSCMVPQKHPFPLSIPSWSQCSGHNGEWKIR